MEVFFIGKRYPKNRDALEDAFRRICQLPELRAESGRDAKPVNIPGRCVRPTGWIGN